MSLCDVQGKPAHGLQTIWHACPWDVQGNSRCFTHILEVLDLASGHAYNMGCLPLGQGKARQKSGVSLLALTLHWGGAPTH